MSRSSANTDPKRKRSRKKGKKEPRAPKSASASTPVASGNDGAIREALRLGRLLSEKCALKEARTSYEEALRLSLAAQDLRSAMEALSGLLMVAGAALDESAIQRLDRELDRLMAAHPRRIPPLAWYCKGAIARHRSDYRVAQRCFHRALRVARAEPERQTGSTEDVHASRDEIIARAWCMLAVTSWDQGHHRRARWLAEELLRRHEARNLRSVNGTLYHLLARLQERQRDFDGSLQWYQKAHGAFLSEHNWYLYLHVLYGCARVARLQQNYPQAYLFLDLVDKGAPGPEFGSLRRALQAERSRLEQDAVDLLIDSRRGIVRTREGGQISLRKQYVLLHILEALSSAHAAEGEGSERGLSKAEIIERVWKESYRPEAHDNKLYYNINRLRKLIEPDVKQPQYLLNSKEGYRLAPGLRIQRVGAQAREVSKQGGKS